jgi:hypothetical protein
VPFLRDAGDEALAELKAIRKALASKENDEDGARPALDQPRSGNTATYFSTGPEPVEVASDDWQRVDFGRVLSEVTIRHTDDIDVAFRNPQNTESAAIPLDDVGEFSMGGRPPLNSAYVWVRQQSSAATTPTVVIVGY